MHDQSQYVPVPQPDELTKEQKSDAQAAYFMMFGAMVAGLPIPIVNALAAFIYYLVTKRKGRFVVFHTYQSMLSQFFVSVVNTVTIAWLITLLVSIKNWDNINPENWNYFFSYLIAAVIFNIVYFIASLIAASRAGKGGLYYFPVFGKMAYHRAFLVSNDDRKKAVAIINTPPS